MPVTENDGLPLAVSLAFTERVGCSEISFTDAIGTRRPYKTPEALALLPTLTESRSAMAWQDYHHLRRWRAEREPRRSNHLGTVDLYRSRPYEHSFPGSMHVWKLHAREPGDLGDA